MMAHWKPASIAPRDCEIIGWDGHEMFLVEWDSDLERFCAGHECITITHWHALPTPPRVMETLEKMTEAMRLADVSYQQSGGGTRHYLRDCLLPEMEAQGLGVVLLPNAV